MLYATVRTVLTLRSVYMGLTDRVKPVIKVALSPEGSVSLVRIIASPVRIITSSVRMIASQFL